MVDVNASIRRKGKKDNLRPEIGRLCRLQLGLFKSVDSFTADLSWRGRSLSVLICHILTGWDCNLLTSLPPYFKSRETKGDTLRAAELAPSLFFLPFF